VRSVLCRFAAMLSVAACAGGCGYDQVVHSWFDHSAETEVSAGSKLAGHVYLLRGVAGDIFSLGIDQLAEKIRRRGVTASVDDFSVSSALADEIIRDYGTGENRGPIVLVGHSTGGDRIIAMAEKLQEAGMPVALAFGLDPTRIADHVPANVAVFINVYQRNNPIGGGEVKPGPGFGGRLINIDLHEHTEIVHITLDKTPAIQDAVTEKIVALIAGAATQQPAAAPAGGGPQVQPLVMNYSVPRDAPIELWDSAIEIGVKSGDTLETVASRYEVPAWAIARINKFEPDRPIEPGRMLLIPRSQYAIEQPAQSQAQLRH
jgi:hypothetical protein